MFKLGAANWRCNSLQGDGSLCDLLQNFPPQMLSKIDQKPELGHRETRDSWKKLAKGLHSVRIFARADFLELNIPRVKKWTICITHADLISILK